MTISSDYQGRKGEQGNIHVHCQLLSNSVVITLIIWTYSTSQMTSWAPLVHISLLLHGWILTLSHRGASASLDRGSSGRAGSSKWTKPPELLLKWMQTDSSTSEMLLPNTFMTIKMKLQFDSLSSSSFFSSESCDFISDVWGFYLLLTLAAALTPLLPGRSRWVMVQFNPTQQQRRSANWSN